MKIFRHFLIIITVGIFLLIFLMVLLRNQQYRYEPPAAIIMLSSDKFQTQPLKSILFWTPFFTSTDFEFGIGHKPFIHHQCEVNTCKTTTNRLLLNSSDAVVFHMQDLRSDDIPLHRYPSQRWIFYLLEPPTKTHEGLHHWNTFFNWTMTYRMDSDIFNPYGRFTPQQLDRTMGKRNYNIEKTKFAVWFASNCYTPSMRERYVQELAKYIPIDIYGDCGNFSCPVRNRKQCLQRAAGTYKFYLSFENCLCKDYATEKVFEPLKLDIVPVVFGSANYSLLTPPNSVINTLDFADAKQLADYLKLVDEYDHLYNYYFKWKAKYNVSTGFAKAFCDLCKKLHDPNLPPKVYDNLEKWWIDEANCSTRPSVLKSNLIMDGLYWFLNKWEKS